MNISVIYSKIKDLESKNISPEVVRYFKNRIIEIEQYISGLELDNFELIHRLEKRDECIDTLCKILIITGNADKLNLDFDSEFIHKSIDLLLESNDRRNHVNISLLATCIAQNIEHGIRAEI